MFCDVKYTTLTTNFSENTHETEELAIEHAKNILNDSNSDCHEVKIFKLYKILKCPKSPIITEDVKL